MYRVLTAFIAIAMFGLVVGLTSDVPDRTDDSEDQLALQDQRTFIGTTRCKTCHRKPASGEQFRIWEESAHSKAYVTLASAEAKEIGAKKGIENPQTADACLKCHATGAGVDAKFLGPKYDIADGVGCESCHGPGQDYYKKATMVLIYKGELDPASVGLVVPTEKTCVGCHNAESPTFKSFNFEESWKKIAHPTPEGGSGASGDDEG